MSEIIGKRGSGIKNIHTPRWSVMASFSTVRTKAGGNNAGGAPVRYCNSLWMFPRPLDCVHLVQRSTNGCNSNCIEFSQDSRFKKGVRTTAQVSTVRVGVNMSW